MHLFRGKVCTLHIATTQTGTLPFNERQIKPAPCSCLTIAKAVCTQTQLIASLHFGMKPHKVENEASILGSRWNAFKLILAHGGNARPRWTRSEHSWFLIWLKPHYASALRQADVTSSFALEDDTNLLKVENRLPRLSLHYTAKARPGIRWYFLKSKDLFFKPDKNYWIGMTFIPNGLTGTRLPRSIRTRYRLGGRTAVTTEADKAVWKWLWLLHLRCDLASIPS